MEKVNQKITRICSLFLSKNFKSYKKRRGCLPSCDACAAMVTLGCKGSAPTKNTLLGPQNHPMLCSAAGQVSPARRCMSGCGGDRKSGPFQRRGKRRRGKRTAAQGSGGGRGRGQVRLWFRKTERESVKRLPHLPCHGMSACSKEHLHCRE